MREYVKEKWKMENGKRNSEALRRKPSLSRIEKKTKKSAKKFDNKVRDREILALYILHEDK